MHLLRNICLVLMFTFLLSQPNGELKEILQAKEKGEDWSWAEVVLLWLLVRKCKFCIFNNFSNTVSAE